MNTHIQFCTNPFFDTINNYLNGIMIFNSDDLKFVFIILFIIMLAPTAGVLGINLSIRIGCHLTPNAYPCGGCNQKHN